MYKLLLLFGTIGYALSSNSQELHSLSHRDLDPISDSGYKIESNEYYLKNETHIPIKGDVINPPATINSLRLYNTDIGTAELRIDFSLCPRFAEGDTARAGLYYVSVMFFDNNRQPLFGHSFRSYRLHTDSDNNVELHTTKMTETEDVNCFSLAGQASLDVHICFLSDPGKYEHLESLDGDDVSLESVAFVAIRIINANAG